MVCTNLILVLTCGLPPQLKDIRCNVDDKDLLLVPISGLPPSYGNFIMTLNSTPPADLTIDYMISCLLNKETHHGGVTAPKDDEENIAMAVASYSHTKCGLEFIICFNCGKKGHYQSNCTEQSQRSRARMVAMKLMLPSQ